MAVGLGMSAVFDRPSHDNDNDYNYNDNDDDDDDNVSLSSCRRFSGVVG